MPRLHCHLAYLDTGRARQRHGRLLPLEGKGYVVGAQAVGERHIAPRGARRRRVGRSLREARNGRRQRVRVRGRDVAVE